MFVDPTRGRSQGFALVAAAAGVLALGACNDPDQNTNLRPDGDPEVLAVLVMNDAANQLVETATYCAPNDEKRPGIVGLPDFTAPNVCPDDLAKGADEVTNAFPDGWYIRIMFDELLDPTVEELTEIKDPVTGEGTDTFTGSIANTHPVKLECESVGGGFVEVEYDGYYSPAGNAVTWPLGPSLVIKPIEARQIATGKSCRVTINDNVTDKTGNKVPAAQRGAFTFKLAPLQVVILDPADDPDGDAPIDPFTLYGSGDNVYVQFNSSVASSSVCDEGTAMDECEFDITPHVGECSTPRADGTVVACNPAMNGSDCPTAADTCDYAGVGDFALVNAGLTDTEFALFTNAPVEGGKKYQFAFKEGTTIKDRCGVATTFGAPSVEDQTLAHYTTAVFKQKTIAPNTGDLVSAMKKVIITYNNFVNLDSFTDADYTLTPPVANKLITTTTEGNIFIAGDYALDTTYTLTLAAGGKVTDYYGAEVTQEAKTITFKTQPAVTATTSPADAATVTKAAAASLAGVTFTFNQSMDPTSLTTADYAFTDSAGTAVVATTTVGAAPNDCTPESTGCQLRVRANLAPGKYKFTLKAGANITGVLGASFTQAADKVINFTVKVADPVTPIQCL
jgi:hypothetical protein